MLVGMQGGFTKFCFYLYLWDSGCAAESYTRGADKSLARPTSGFILFDGKIFRLVPVLLYIYI